MTIIITILKLRPTHTPSFLQILRLFYRASFVVNVRHKLFKVPNFVMDVVQPSR
jgi:hypothetical protein